jgi:methylase of polypeptide subunit release factors
MISLVQMEVEVEEGERKAKDKDQQKLKQKGVGNTMVYAVETPRRYLKFMKREHLFYLRNMASSSSPLSERVTPFIIKTATGTDTGTTDTTTTATAIFQGLCFQYPAEGSLRPRESSAPLVRAARRHLLGLDRTQTRPRLVSCNNDPLSPTHHYHHRQWHRHGLQLHEQGEGQHALSGISSHSAGNSTTTTTSAFTNNSCNIDSSSSSINGSSDDSDSSSWDDSDHLPPAVLDLGTGCGALLISLLAPPAPSPSQPSTSSSSSSSTSSPLPVWATESSQGKESKGSGKARVDGLCVSEEEKVSPPPLSATPCILGVGLDLNPHALACARSNATRLLPLPSPQQPHDQTQIQPHTQTQTPLVQFLQGSFLDLDSLHHQLLSSSTSTTSQQQQEEQEEGGSSISNNCTSNCYTCTYSGFDVIMCNPPFLSHRAARDRITAEGRGALVGGATGYEAYDSICASLRASLDNSSNFITPCSPHHPPAESSDITLLHDEEFLPLRPAELPVVAPLLKPGGRVIFQISGAARAVTHVSSILHKHGFFVEEVLIDITTTTGGSPTTTTTTTTTRGDTSATSGDTGNGGAGSGSGSDAKIRCIRRGVVASNRGVKAINKT